MDWHHRAKKKAELRTSEGATCYPSIFGALYSQLPSSSSSFFQSKTILAWFKRYAITMWIQLIIDSNFCYLVCRVDD